MEVIQGVLRGEHKSQLPYIHVRLSHGWIAHHQIKLIPAVTHTLLRHLQYPNPYFYASYSPNGSISIANIYCFLPFPFLAASSRTFKLYHEGATRFWKPPPTLLILCLYLFLPRSQNTSIRTATWIHVSYRPPTIPEDQVSRAGEVLVNK